MSTTPYSSANSAVMNVPPDRFITSGSAASAAITRPGNSGEQPTVGSVTVCFVISGLRRKLRSARSVNVRPCHSDSDATWYCSSSTAISRAIRSTADLHMPNTTP
jgi:hypothetical protein